MFALLKRFFDSPHDSVKGWISPEELYRSILMSISSGTVIGVLILLLQTVLAHTSTIFPDPTVASLASILLTLVLDLLRRQNQGSKPTPITPVGPQIPTA